MNTTPSREMKWGEIMLCVEILSMLCRMQDMDRERFFTKPNETYSKYLTHKLSKNLHLIQTKKQKMKEKVENKLNELIASMDRDEFLSNEPLSAEAFFSYHRSPIRRTYYSAIHFLQCNVWGIFCLPMILSSLNWGVDWN